MLRILIVHIKIYISFIRPVSCNSTLYFFQISLWENEGEHFRFLSPVTLYESQGCSNWYQNTELEMI